MPSHLLYLAWTAQPCRDHLRVQGHLDNDPAVQAFQAAMDANDTISQCPAALKLLKPRDEDVTVYDEEADRRIAVFAANYCTLTQLFISFRFD